MTIGVEGRSWAEAAEARSATKSTRAAAPRLVIWIATVADYNAAITPFLFLLALTQAVLAAPFTLTPSPSHARLFAPPHAAAAYRFEVTPARIEDVAAAFGARGSELGARTDHTDSWKVESASVLDVFDGAAMYDRSRLARLVGGKSVRIVRGPIIRDGVVAAAVLLLSPYPEADLRRMNPGTLVMTVELPPNGDR